MRENQKVSIHSTESLISLGKSKRLATMRKSVELDVEKSLLSKKSRVLFDGDGHENELQQARELVTQNIARIKATYRQGMQNRLFALRFGTGDEISQMTLKKLFNILNIKQVLAESIAHEKLGDTCN